MITGAVLLAFACWAFTFGIAWGNFWVKIGFSVTVICLYSLIWHKPSIRFTLNNVLAGIVSAAVLYGLFVLGNLLAPYIIPGAGRQVGGIYDLGTGTDRILIFLLLCFITGPGEEIFWRGFLQENLMQRYGDLCGYLLATLIYGGVHLFSLNIMLILAALAAGAFWGMLYLWRRDLGLVIVSHSLWSAFIFAVFPVH
ncbi:MAG: CPBP family intramembrane metalloprotease [Proteobacteria bacterium]|nr:CPBP family intramembrane metalloprotease [Pseudomonadota bacterium]